MQSQILAVLLTDLLIYLLASHLNKVGLSFLGWSMVWVCMLVQRTSLLFFYKHLSDIQ